jgi:hypothetical protein
MELAKRPMIRVETRVSDYDRVSGSLTSAVIVSGFVVAILVAVWFAPSSTDRTLPDSLVLFSTEAAQLVEVAVDVEEPVVAGQLGQTVDLFEAIERVDVVSTVRAMAGKSGVGDVDQRDPNPWAIPRVAEFQGQHWHVEYQVETIEQYARMLDYFGVELGGVERDASQVVYVKNFLGERQLRAGEKKSEGRVYFLHTSVTLRKWDSELLDAAKVENAARRIPLHFYPADVIDRLRELEDWRIREDGKSLSAIERTRFRVVEESDGYKFELVAIEYSK